MKMTDKIRRLLAKGASTAEIAKKLKIKPAYVHTVKWLDKKAKAKQKIQVERSHDPKVVKAEKWDLKIEGGKIIVEEGTIELLLTLLNNDRLRSPINDEVFDSSAKKAVT